MAEIILQVRELNEKLAHDPFLGKGTLAVSQSFFSSPSRCAVADMSAISIDRRLTWGETWQQALDEISALPAVQKYGAKVSMYRYDSPAYTGLVYPSDCYFPAWVLPEDHPALAAAVKAHRGLFGEPLVDKWTFSTNGVSIMGRYGIPCLGFGPGFEAQAHAPNEMTVKEHLLRAAALYAAIPKLWREDR
jgi:putative selenium metabolism hydrolase